MKFETDWVKVSDRLPDEEVEVLVLVDTGKQAVASINEKLEGCPESYVEWSSGEVTEGYYGSFNGEVTHWRSLPKPPVKSNKFRGTFNSIKFINVDTSSNIMSVSNSETGEAWVLTRDGFVEINTELLDPLSIIVFPAHMLEDSIKKEKT